MTTDAMSIDTQNSWYMSKPLSDCPNLFSKEETSNELVIWAENMHNCISGYAYPIKKRKKIYSAFKDGRILYAIEVSPSMIREMSGKYNREIPADDKNIINQ